MKMRVLVVDDCKGMRTVLSAVLESVGYSVETAADGLSGLARFMADPPDAIITDVNMPVMDGLTFVGEVRRQSRGADLPIFVLSSDGSADKRERARGYGVRRWLDKPADMTAMAAAVLQATG